MAQKEPDGRYSRPPASGICFSKAPLLIAFTLRDPRAPIGRSAASRPGRPAGLLVEAEHVAIRAGDACRQFRRVPPARLTDPAAVRDDGFHGRFETVMVPAGPSSPRSRPP